MNKQNKLILSVGMVMFLMLFMFPAEFSQGAATGLKNSASVIIPSLFPFMVAASLIGEGELPVFLRKVLEPVTQKLFGQPAESFGAVLTGLLGGYPSGSRAAASLYRSGKITAAQARSLMLFCVNPGTGFCVNAVGAAMLGSEKAGLIIFSSLCISALFLGLFTKPEADGLMNSAVPAPKSFSQIFVESVATGASGIISVCAFATLFSGALAVITRFSMSKNAVIFTACLLEITSGCASAAGEIPIPLIASACAFGGLCVHMQIFSLAEDIKPGFGKFILFRLLHAALSGTVCKLLLTVFPVEIQTFLSVSQNASLYSFSVPAAVSLLFFSSLLIFDLDKQRKIC